MRACLFGDGGGPPRPPHRPGKPARAPFGVAQGCHAERHDAGGRQPATQPPAAAARAAPPARVEAALRAALGLQPFLGVDAGARRTRDPARPGQRPPRNDTGRIFQTLHRRGARAHAHTRLHACQRAPQRAAARPGGAVAAPGQRPHAGAGTGPGAAGVRDPRPVLHAVGGRRGAGLARPGSGQRAGHRLLVAGAAANRRDGAARLGVDGAGQHAQPAVAVEPVPPPDPPADGLVRQAPHRRRGVALRVAQQHPAHPDHQLSRSPDRRRDGRRHAGHDVFLQRQAGLDRRHGRRALRRVAAAAVPALPARQRRADRARRAPAQPLSGERARHAGHQAVRPRRPAQHGLAKPGGRPVQRHLAHPAPGAAVSRPQRRAVRRRKRAHRVARRAPGARHGCRRGRRLLGRHAVRVRCLQDAVRAARGGADREGARDAHARPAHRAGGRHRTHGVRAARRHGLARRRRHRLPGNGRQHRAEKREFPLRRLGPAADRQREPARGVVRIGGHRRAIGRRQDDAHQADARPAGAHLGQHRSRRRAAGAAGPGALSQRRGVRDAGRPALRRFDRREHLLFRPASRQRAHRPLRAPGSGARRHPRHADEIQHPGGRHGHRVFGRAEAAHLAGPRAVPRAEDPVPGRSHQPPRHRPRAQRQRSGARLAPDARDRGAPIRNHRQRRPRDRALGRAGGE